MKANHRVVLGCLVVSSAILGCSPNNSGSVNAECEDLSAMAAPVTPMVKGTVFTIVVENHSASQVFDPRSGAQFMIKMAKQYATALGYHDSFVHPSEAN